MTAEPTAAGTTTIEAVLFDWGGTLTPWRMIDPEAEWRALAGAAAPEQVERVTAALVEAAGAAWLRARSDHSSATFADVCATAGITASAAAVAAYRACYDHATYTDPDAPPLLAALRARGVRTGVLSNTLWPRAWHEEVLARDGVLELFDGAVFSSELPWVKPHAEAFIAAMRSVGVENPAACVYVGDRLFEDIHGAKSAGMRAVLVPHSDIPDAQRGQVEGEPDAVVERLADLLPLVDSWRTD